jgi:SynChlorMet cassette protein ScmD
LSEENHNNGMTMLKESNLANTDKPLANPLIVLRKDFDDDDWAILFDPDKGDAYGLNPVSVFIWQRLDGKHSLADILEEMRAHYDGVPQEAEDHLQEFIDHLMSKGLAGYQFQASS